MTTFGAIRWDAFYNQVPGEPGQHTAFALGTPEFIGRAPVNSIIRGTTDLQWTLNQTGIDAEIAAAKDAGTTGAICRRWMPRLQSTRHHRSNRR